VSSPDLQEGARQFSPIIADGAVACHVVVTFASIECDSAAIAKLMRRPVVVALIRPDLPGPARWSQQ
jgi:hypothetical protein